MGARNRFMRYRLVTVLTLTIMAGFILIPTSGADLLSGKILGDKLRDMANTGAGVQDIQDAMDGEEFTAQRIDGQQLLDKISATLTTKFKSAFEAVQKIKNRTEEGFKQGVYEDISSLGTSTLIRCCKVDDTSFEVMDRLGIKADPETMCYRKSHLARSQMEVVVSDEILKVMRENFLTHSWLKSQYIGTEDGFSATYPAKHEQECGLYTPRFRPWYVETATPMPKDIVLVLDKSSSMANGGLMEIAKDAAKSVLDTLSPNDRVGVVDFSSDAFTPPGSSATDNCYESKLAFATTDNISYLKDYISQISPDGQTNYITALIKAFAFFEDTPEPFVEAQFRYKAILFLTDGEPSSGTSLDIYKTIREHNSILNNSVIVLTYGIGEVANAEKQSAVELLRTMAFQNHSDPAAGPIKPGIFTPVENSQNLREKLGTYYNVFSKYKSDTPIVTVPYIDFFREELIVSFCLPLYDPSKSVLRGVTCIDVGIEDLAADVSNAKQGEYSYAFLIDGTGRTTMHPLLPKPSPGEKTSVFVDISVLERDVKTVIDNMKRGNNGTDTRRVPFVVPRGNATTNGADQITLIADYHYKKLAGTNFSLCLVVSERDMLVRVGHQSARRSRFVYHRLDLDPDNDKEDEVPKCNFLNKLSTKDYTTVMFTSAAFKDSAYLSKNKENAIQIQRFKNYFEGDDVDGNDSPFKDGVRDMIVTTARIEEHLKQDSVYDSYMVWRYIGVYNGFIRLYPGHALDLRYDHTARTWYETAMALRGLAVVSAPYVDAFGAGIVSTLSQTIAMGKSGGLHADTDPIVGVVGMDFKMEYLAKIIGDSYPECKTSSYKCFILDDRGYFVYHKELEHTYGVGKGLKDEHVTEKEHDIAYDLIQDGNLVRTSCVIFKIKQNMFTWKLELKSGTVNKMSSHPFYHLDRVPRTNLYVGIKKAARGSTHDCTCREPNTYANLVRCHRSEAMDCECPCYSPAKFHYCTNLFALDIAGTPACPPLRWSISFATPIPDEPALAMRYPSCYPTECQNWKLEEDCQGGVVGCAWCFTMSSPHTQACVDRYICYTPTINKATTHEATTTGVTNATDSVTVNTADGSAGVSQSLIIGVAGGGGGLLLLIVIVLSVCIYKRRSKKPRRAAHEPQGSAHDLDRENSYAELDHMRIKTWRETEERIHTGKPAEHLELDEGDYIHTTEQFTIEGGLGRTMASLAGVLTHNALPRTHAHATTTNAYIIDTGRPGEPASQSGETTLPQDEDDYVSPIPAST